MTPWQIGPGKESIGAAGGLGQTSNLGPCQPGFLVDPTSARTRDLVGRDSWLTPHFLGPGTNSAIIAHQPHSSLDLGPSQPGQLVDPTSARTQVRVSSDSWSNPRTLGPGTESAGTAGRPHSSLDPWQWWQALNFHRPWEHTPPSKKPLEAWNSDVCGVRTINTGFCAMSARRYCFHEK